MWEQWETGQFSPDGAYTAYVVTKYIRVYIQSLHREFVIDFIRPLVLLLLGPANQSLDFCSRDIHIIPLHIILSHDLLFPKRPVRVSAWILVTDLSAELTSSSSPLSLSATHRHHHRQAEVVPLSRSEGLESRTQAPETSLS